MSPQTPVTTAIAMLYVGLAALTGLFDADTERLIAYGATVPALVSAGEPWRLLTGAFLHGGILHLGFNTLALITIGPMLEMRLGSLRYALLYVVGALGGSVGGVLSIAPFESMSMFAPLVGGSGALFAMLGALVASNLRSNRTLLDFFDDGRSRGLLTLIAVNLALGFLIPVVSNSAHIGGLLTGFAWTFWFLDVDRRGRNPVLQTSLWRARALVVAMTLGWTLYVVFPVLRADYQLARGFDEAARASGFLPVPQNPSTRAAYRRQILGELVRQGGWPESSAKRLAEHIYGDRGD
jgi:membrane associated rhomboid family serine protease